MFRHLKLFTSFELCQTKAIIKFYTLFRLATYVLVESKNSLKYFVGNSDVNFVYRYYSRYMTSVTSDFHVICPHFLRADIQMVSANRSQSFTFFLLLHLAYCYDYFFYSNSCTLFIRFKNHQFTLIL
jgi:hypothetical protein